MFSFVFLKVKHRYSIAQDSWFANLVVNISVNLPEWLNKVSEKNYKIMEYDKIKVTSKSFDY